MNSFFSLSLQSNKINTMIMKKTILDLRVVSVEHIHEKYVLLKLTHENQLPDIMPGQFVEVRVDNSPKTFLRRPISISFVDKANNEIWLLVAVVGCGTRRMSELCVGDTLNCLFPLGNSFTLSGVPLSNKQAQEVRNQQILLVGGGVGVAPLLCFGHYLHLVGITPSFLLGARSSKDLLLLDEFKKYGNVFVTTEDGSAGERGFVTNHSILQHEHFVQISTCGPKPMMMAVAKYARTAGIYCEASLENMMACGLGACLCCVEKTTEGNLCVCKDGPVFDMNRLLW